MDHDSLMELSFGNRRVIEGATVRPDVNVLEEKYQRQRDEQSESQRFLRQHDHIPTMDDLGFAGYDPVLEDRYRPFLPQIAAAELIEERPEVLRRASTVHNGGFRRYITPPTTPERPAVLPVGRIHDIMPPLPGLLPNTPRQSDRVWYSPEFYAGTLQQVRARIHLLEASFICNNLDLLTEVLLLAFKLEFPIAPWSNAYIRRIIEEARWHAKRCVWKAEGITTLRLAARQNHSEEAVWLALRAKWPYYPKDRRAVSRKYGEIQQLEQDFALAQGAQP